MAIKVVIDGAEDTSLLSHELDQSLITFGRSKSCHIELDHPGISRRHFIIRFEDNAYVLLDENSRHGTNLDGIALEAEKPYLLGKEHTISVPGFNIKLYCDGEKPRLERTTVVARKLLDDLLQGDISPRECPSLRSKDLDYDFKFVEEKTTFVLGTLSTADFVVHDKEVAKKHLSFTRDIFGIRLIPLPNQPVLVNGQAVLEPEFLSPEAVIKIGSLEFTFIEAGGGGEDSQKKIVEEAQTTPLAEDAPPTIMFENETKNASPIKKISKGPFWALDRIFVVAFFATALGALFMIVDLL
jgi:hypothetical protein